MNQVILIGRAGKDAELRYTAGGTAVASFSLATTKKFRDKNGELKEKTAWHNIVCWGKTAETAAEFVCKGKQVAIRGEIDYSDYEKDGQKHYKTEIVVEDLELLGGMPKRE